MPNHKTEVVKAVPLEAVAVAKAETTPAGEQGQRSGRGICRSPQIYELSQARG